MMTLTDRLFARSQPLRTAYAYRLLGILVSLIAVFCVWTSWATLEEQIRATGTVIVSSRSQVVQAVDGGVLRKLHVREGDSVKAGDLIAELDTVRFEASSEEVVAKVMALRAVIARLEAEIDERPLEFPPEVADRPEITSAQRDLYDRRRQLQREEQSAIELSLKLAEEELTSLEQLAKTGDASRTEVLRQRRIVNDLRASAVNKRNAYRQEAQAELARSRSELEQSEQVLTQRREALQSTRIRAPMTGTVKNVRITTLGAVLKAGEELLQIVPSDDPLIVEARVKPADVAFVRKDLRANVKLAAYDYTVYGSLKGHVTYISPDTLQEELRRDEEPYYRVHIQIDEFPQGKRDKIEVIPGMTATVEIITGERTVAQYLLKPVRRVSGEALVER
jgi:membrane fusion protein, adhesin transport system